MNRVRPVVQVMILLALAVVAGTISNVTAGPTRRLAWIAEWKLPAPTPRPSPGAATTIEIGSAEAVAEHGKGTLFLDARRSEAYAEGHIPGARPFPVWESETDPKIVELMSEFPPGARIVVYCTGGKCEDSHLLRGKLLAAGYTDVLVFKDGMPGWEAAGQPVEK